MGSGYPGAVFFGEYSTGGTVPVIVAGGPLACDTIIGTYVTAEDIIGTAVTSENVTGTVESCD